MRKGRCLYELNKAIRALGPGELLPEHEQEPAAPARQAGRQPGRHPGASEAVSEVAELIKSAMTRAEADGTYSAQTFGYAL